MSLDDSPARLQSTQAVVPVTQTTVHGQVRNHTQRRQTMQVRFSRRTFIGALLIATVTHAAQAQPAYPTKPVQFVVASSAGGILDTIGRIVARGLETMGQPVVVLNQPGAGGTIGTATVAHAAPDGYTLGMVATSHAINPSVYSRMPYDTTRDLVPLSQAVALRNVFVVHPSVPAKDLQEFIRYAKANPGKLTFGSAGNGQSNHLSGEMLNTAAGIRMMYIPYKGSANALADVLGGSLTGMFVDALSAIPQVRSGKLRALAVSGDGRLVNAPDIPTFAEAGMPDFNVNSWLGVVGRAGTPPEIVAKAGKAAGDIMRDPVVRKQLLDMGVEPVGSSPEEFAKFLDVEIKRYAEVVRNAGVKLD